MGNIFIFFNKIFIKIKFIDIFKLIINIFIVIIYSFN